LGKSGDTILIFAELIKKEEGNLYRLIGWTSPAKYETIFSALPLPQEGIVSAGRPNRVQEYIMRVVIARQQFEIPLKDNKNKGLKRS
jgi:hypothetical protein